MIIFIPLNACFANKGKKLHRAKLKTQDSRIKIINEILSGIRVSSTYILFHQVKRVSNYFLKVIRFYAWELSFFKIVNKIRDKEIRNLVKSSLLSTVTNLTWGLIFFNLFRIFCF